MNKWLSILQMKVDALALRERVLIFLTGAALLFLVWDLLMFSPQESTREGLNQQLLVLQQKIDAQAQEAKTLARLVTTGSDFGKMQQLAELESESATLDNTVSMLKMALISADDLLSVLEDVLQHSNKLTIKHIEALSPREIKLNLVNNSGEAATTGIMSHTVVLTLEGSYFDLLSYLKGLEELPWSLYWDSLNYRVSRYPFGIIELKVSTLTMEDTVHAD